jgi:hypothetical protein
MCAVAAWSGVAASERLIEMSTRRFRSRRRPYLENCTVDASIFVAKLIRAHGGCLGTRSR